MGSPVTDLAASMALPIPASAQVVLWGRGYMRCPGVGIDCGGNVHGTDFDAQGNIYLIDTETCSYPNDYVVETTYISCERSCI